MGNIDVVEAAYRTSADATEWLATVASFVCPLLDAGHGGFALVAENIEPTRIELGPMVLHDCANDLKAFVTQATRSLPPEDFAKTYGSSQVFDSMSGRAGRYYSPDHWMFAAFRQHFGLEDFDLLRAVDPSGFGFLAAAGRTTAYRPKRRERARWSLLAAHIIAGLRAHRAMAKEPAETSPLERPRVEAVLGPSGNLLHAKGLATGRDARQDLRSAVRRVDRARSSLRERDPDRALEAWLALVSGRWSLVDVFDTDGKRFVVARENRPSTEPILALSPREREIVAYVRLGQSNKLIAYTLGLAESTVSEHLRRALAKLGARSRADLVLSAGQRGP
jgi:DNA-binding CsgD family transcriptional regulator